MSTQTDWQAQIKGKADWLRVSLKANDANQIRRDRAVLIGDILASWYEREGRPTYEFRHPVTGEIPYAWAKYGIHKHFAFYCRLCRTQLDGMSNAELIEFACPTRDHDAPTYEEEQLAGAILATLTN